MSASTERKPTGRCLAYGCGCQAYELRQQLGAWAYCACDHTQQSHEEVSTDAPGAVAAPPDADA